MATPQNTPNGTAGGGIPGIPTPLESTEYVLTYRYRRVLHTMNYKFKGSWAASMEQAKKFCESQNYQFINIEKMFQDIEHLIEKKAADDESHIVRGVLWKPTDVNGTQVGPEVVVQK